MLLRIKPEKRKDREGKISRRKTFQEGFKKKKYT